MDKKFAEKQKNSIEMYESVKEKGIKAVFEQDHESVDYNEPMYAFQYTHFVASVLMMDYFHLINEFAAMRDDEIKVPFLEVFSLQFDMVIKKLKILEMSVMHSVVKDPQSKTDWENTLECQKDYISGMIEVTGVMLNVLEVALGNDINIDLVELITEYVKEFYACLDKLKEIGGDKNGEA